MSSPVAAKMLELRLELVLIDIGWGGGVDTQLGHAARIQPQGQYLNNNTEYRNLCPCLCGELLPARGAAGPGPGWPVGTSWS